jgi:cytosine deaminase
MTIPAFVEPHLHLDKAFVWEMVRSKEGTLDKAIAAFSKIKPNLDEGGIKSRGLAVLEALVRNGVTTVRAQVDVDQWLGLKGVRGALWLKAAVSELLDIQVVAFPQEGIRRHPPAGELLAQAVELGVDALGGIPAIEAGEKDALHHVETVMNLAQAAGIDVDMHIDENSSRESRTLELLADVTLDMGFSGGVTASHCCALSFYDDHYAERVIEKTKKAGISVVSLPGTNLVAQGRGIQPSPRGLTRVKELLAAGVNVALGQDSVQSVLYPFGQGDPLEVAFLAAHALHFTAEPEVEELLRMVTSRAARAIGVQEKQRKLPGRAFFHCQGKRNCR